jgi:hypothetical protein
MIRPLLVGLIVVALAGCHGNQAAAPTPGPRSPAGWEVRYNAALALAHRGSAAIKEPVPWESLLEMLDEQQQMRNFTTRLSDGREVPDETAARLTVIGALKAVQTLHRANPSLDLSALSESIAKLNQSGNAAVRTEAEKTRLTLADK